MSRLLLVEDNEMTRDMLSRRLQRRDYGVIIAVDGEAGIKMAGSGAPEEEALAVGCDDYDTKLIEFARLLEKIQSLLGAETS